VAARMADEFDPATGGRCEGVDGFTPCDGGSGPLITRRARWMVRSPSGGLGRHLCGTCARALSRKRALTDNPHLGSTSPFS
jgi:hypothetical protein